METYRSGHNGADSKSVSAFAPAGSNPAVSAIKKESVRQDWFLFKLLFNEEFERAVL